MTGYERLIAAAKRFIAKVDAGRAHSVESYAEFQQALTMIETPVHRLYARGYPITIQQLPESEGGGFIAVILPLGSATFNSAGDTPEEALECLADLADTLFERFTAEGVSIPEPRLAMDQWEELWQKAHPRPVGMTLEELYATITGSSSFAEETPTVAETPEED